MKKRILCGIVAMAMLLCACLSATAEGKDPAQELIERTVVSFAAYGGRDTQALEELRTLDPAKAEK